MYYGKWVFFMSRYRRNKKSKVVPLISAFIAFCIVLLSVYSYFSVRRIIVNTARNTAQTIAFNIANRVISEQMNDEEITYNDIVKLTKNDQQNITALEIDIVKINQLKSKISSEISKAVTKDTDYIVGIPLGNLLGSEYTLGFGPTINFKMQVSVNVVTDFQSNFYSAGINQVLHQILIKVNINGNLVIPWNHAGFSTETTIIAAQTVLVGLTPDAYTNVLENYNGADGESRTVDDIFDFGATN